MGQGISKSGIRCRFPFFSPQRNCNKKLTIISILRKKKRSLISNASERAGIRKYLVPVRGNKKGASDSRSFFFFFGPSFVSSLVLIHAEVGPDDPTRN